jgi:inhibitor of cysteine peptidase
MADVTISEAQTGSSVEVQVGDRVIITLEETPTSGFRWELDALDEAILEFESSDFVPADPSLLGGGGARQVSLRVKQAGSAHIALKLWRAWEGEASVTRRFEAEILARP